MLEKMVTEWYRALAAQSCRRLRFDGWHRDGSGYELRQASLNQLQAHYIRKGIRDLITGAKTRDQVVLISTTAFMSECRTRGLQNYDKVGANMYADALVAERGIRTVLETFRIPLNVHEAAPEIRFEIVPGRVEFHSDPLAILAQSEDATDLALYYIKVTGRWDDQRRRRLDREFRLLSELAAAVYTYKEGISGAVVDVIQPEAPSYKRVQRTFVPINLEWLHDWIEQVENQENSIICGVQTYEDDENNVGDDAKRAILNNWFPQNRQSCDYPYPCQFLGHCWGNSTLHDAQYRQRIDLLQIQGVTNG
jgi:hypothetical protein